MNPLVSIVVPVYGVEKYIERCAISLLEQSYDSIEYIFVDDCTKDNSIGILKAVLDRYPLRKANVKIVTNVSNCGQAAVRNIGVSHCTGSFLMHVDSDDWLDSEVVEKCIKVQGNEDADIVIFDRQFYKSSGMEIHSASQASDAKAVCLEMLERSRDISIWGMLIRKSLYSDHGLSCIPGVNMSEDFQITPRLAYYADKIAVMHGAFYNYECRNMGSISARFKAKNVHQEWVTYDVLAEFFKDKGSDYSSALNKGLLFLYCRQRQNACYYGMKELYRETGSRIFDLTQRDIKSLPLGYRIGLNIKNFYLLRLYVSVCKMIKKLNKK